jgi:hypothetical protein
VSGGTIIYGDPHGNWLPLLRACEAERPEGVVILGDCDLALPVREQIKPIFDAGIRVRWIPGNHDVDREEWHDRLWGDYLIIAGLGGVFHEKVWYPRFEDAESQHASRRDFMRVLPKGDRWRNGMPLKRRSAIFPEDVRALEELRADVLVTHEAPSCHRYGFIGINKAARACRARLMVHGHHHESYRGTLPDGTRVQGLAKAEVLRLRREDLP